MTLAEHISDKLNDLFLEGDWIANTNWKSELNRFDFPLATREVTSVNTIARITGHVNYYLEGLLQVMNGGPLTMHDSESFSINVTTPADWQTLTKRFIHNAEQFAIAIGKLDDSFLETDFIDPRYGTWRKNIEAVIEHGYYHLGQVVLLRKLNSVQA